MKRLLLCLESGGRVLHETRSSDLHSPVVIGRAPDCDWRCPPEDAASSARHAELFRRRGSVWIRDLQSRNGLTCAGERITERRLRPGDRIHIGSCVVSVEQDTSAAHRDPLPHHRLEQLNGADAGRVLELVDRGDLVIGSSPDSSIVCSDPLVSRSHTALAVKQDGSVWARDLQSRNGTTVNGTALRKDKERMLRDGDILSVAYVEFRFVDKTVEHPRAHLVRKILVAAATVAVVLTGWYTYASLRPGAKALLAASINLASDARVDEAESIARDAAEARGADAYARRRREILQNIDAWRATAAAWDAIRERFAAHDFDSAQELSVRLRDWNWNATSAPLEGLRADRALALVRSVRAAQHALDGGAGVEVLDETKADLTAARDALLAPEVSPSGGLPWTKPLLDDADRILPELAETAHELREAELVADALHPGDVSRPPVAAAEALAALDAILARNAARRPAPDAPPPPFHPSHALEARAGELRAPLRALADSEAAFASNLVSIAAARWEDPAPLPLPSPQLAGIHPAFPSYSEHLRRLDDTLRGPVLVGWRARLSALEAVGLDPVAYRLPPVFSALLSPDVARRVLEFVPSPAPAPARAGDPGPVPQCAYDAYVGILDFADFLENLDPESSFSAALSAYGTSSEGWETVVESARDVCARLRACRSYAAATGAPGLLARMVLATDVPDGPNRVALTLNAASNLLSARDRWIASDFPALCDREGSARAGFLARGIRLLLADTPDAEEASSLARDWRTYRRSLPKWDGNETSARDIFHEALPGVSAHRRVWTFLHDLPAASPESPAGEGGDAAPEAPNPAPQEVAP